MTPTQDGFLTAQRVREVYEKCFRPEQSPPLTHVAVDAWMFRHTFSIRMLQRAREDIIRMLLSLPAGFRVDEREGGSVANMISRNDNSVWSTDLTDVEKLIALGMGVGLVTFCAPREKWHKLPGGLPYVRIEITKFGVSVN